MNHLLKFTFAICIVTACISCKTNIDCSRVKNGRFHVYPGGRHSIIDRTDSVHREFNTVTGDTSYWQIGWLDDCKFVVHYQSGLRTQSKEEEEFLQKTIGEYTITSVTPDYYTTSGLVKMPLGEKTYVDTTWFKER